MTTSTVILTTAYPISKLRKLTQFALIDLFQKPATGRQRNTAAMVSANHHIHTKVMNQLARDRNLAVSKMRLYISRAAILIAAGVAI